MAMTKHVGRLISTGNVQSVFAAEGKYSLTAGESASIVKEIQDLKQTF